MKNILKSIATVITWPYRTASEFVDARPSASQIKTHLLRHTPAIEETPDGVIVSLNLIGTDLVATDVQARSVETPSDLPLAKSWAEGVALGYTWGANQAVSLKRSDFARDSRVLKQITKLDKAENQFTKAAVGLGGKIQKAGKKLVKAADNLVEAEAEDTHGGGHIRLAH